MTHPSDADRVAARSELLPEEQALDVQDSELLAEAVLAESDERAADPGAEASTPSAEH